MFARVTRFQCDPSRLDDLTAKLDHVKAQVQAISGVVGVYSAWRADGDGVTMAIYESQAAAEAAGPQVQGIWAGLADLLLGPPSAETYDNVMHLSS